MSKKLVMSLITTVIFVVASLVVREVIDRVEERAHDCIESSFSYPYGQLPDHCQELHAPKQS